MRRCYKKGIALFLIMAFVACGVSSAPWPQDSHADAASEEMLDDVVFSEPSGVYGEAFDLKLSCQDETAQIFYTMDGSDPAKDANENRQSLENGGIVPIVSRTDDENVLSAIDPILFDSVNVAVNEDGTGFDSTVEAPKKEDVDKCTIIKAAVRYADGTYSPVYTNTYFVGSMAEHIRGIEDSCKASGMDLAVMSISMDKDDLFDPEKGIYVKGNVFEKALANRLEEDGSIWDTEECRRLDANYKQKGKSWERNTHIDYFESNGAETSCKLQQDCGIRIQGNYSRSDYQKGFRLYARQEYGSKNFKYAFWPDEKDDAGNVMEKYKKIVLRNGGNCAFTTKFSDSYWQSLMQDVNVDTQSARPCIVYLNGEYWGVYILQTDYCNDLMEDKHGVLKDDVVIYKGDAEVNRELGYKLDDGDLPEGVTDEDYYFRELEEFLETHKDVSEDSDFEKLAELVDVESAIDYFALQVWINNKWDWPGKNWSMWKTKTIDPSIPYADGKWRYLIYDVEFGGISGKDDASENAVKNSKLLEIGSRQNGDTNYDKPNVRCFAMLMTNRSFRDAFIQRLEGLSSGMFEKEAALQQCGVFEETYRTLLDQFFRRFPVKWQGWGNPVTADMAINGDGGNTYGTSANIRKFLESREKYIPRIVKFIRKEYNDPDPAVTPEPTAAPQETPAGGQVTPPSDPAAQPPAGAGTQPAAGGEQPPAAPVVQPTETPSENPKNGKKISPLKITAKKGSRTIRVTTVKKSEVKVSLSEKILKMGKKKKKVITIPAEKNKTGKVRLSLSNGLKKGTKITVKVSKAGYKTETKALTIR